MKLIKGLILWLLKCLGLKVVTISDYEKLYLMSRAADDIDVLKLVDRNNHSFFIESLKFSKAQLRQDILALIYNNCRDDGFFVEFGAFDGKNLSNTWLLEKHYKWKGILAEPTKSLHQSILKERTAILDTNCVWSTSGEAVDFSEVNLGELSTVTSFLNTDNHAVSRVVAHNYKVPTISLLDLLEKYDAPKHIDYLSVDTEGSEWKILSAFDFEKYTFGFITVEHNYGENESKLDALMSSSGYARILREASKFDAWYVPSKIATDNDKLNM